MMIKRCPFCGGKAERVDLDAGENAGGSCVCCTQCMASSNVEFGFKENFIDNWNRRAVNRTPAFEAMREALESIDAVGCDFGHFEAAARTMQEIARETLKKIGDAS